MSEAEYLFEYMYHLKAMVIALFVIVIYHILPCEMNGYTEERSKCNGHWEHLYCPLRQLMK